MAKKMKFEIGNTIWTEMRLWDVKDEDLWVKKWGEPEAMLIRQVYVGHGKFEVTYHTMPEDSEHKDCMYCGMPLVAGETHPKDECRAKLKPRKVTYKQIMQSHDGLMKYRYSHMSMHKTEDNDIWYRFWND